MNQQKVTPDEVLANMRKTIENNFQNYFDPLSLPGESFTSDDDDSIEPFDLQRVNEPEFKAKMRRWLKLEGEHTGRVARRLGINEKLVLREVRKMRLEDPEVIARLREVLNRPGPRDYADIAMQFGVAATDVDQVARDMLLDDPEFLKLLA